MKIGDKVVCINDDFHYETIRRVPCLSKKDEVYTILDTVIKLSTGEIGLILKELRNPLLEREGTDMRFEPSFGSWRFVPVTEVDDLVEIEEELLTV